MQMALQSNPYTCTFDSLQRRLCQLLAQPRVFCAHDVLRLQVEHGLRVRGDGIRRWLQLVALDLHLHLSGHLHALLVHGAAVEGGSLRMLLELLGKLIASKNQPGHSKLDAASRGRHRDHGTSCTLHFQPGDHCYCNVL